MESFCENYALKNLIRQPTRYKNLSNPACIDLILATGPDTFQSTCVVETGLSDFHLMTLTVMRKSLRNIIIGNIKILLMINIERRKLIICPKKFLLIMVMVF